jgi:hypothetical protein
LSRCISCLHLGYRNLGESSFVLFVVVADAGIVGLAEVARMAVVRLVMVVGLAELV